MHSPSLSEYLRRMLHYAGLSVPQILLLPAVMLELAGSFPVAEMLVCKCHSMDSRFWMMCPGAKACVQTSANTPSATHTAKPP